MTRFRHVARAIGLRILYPGHPSVILRHIIDKATSSRLHGEKVRVLDIGYGRGLHWNHLSDQVYQKIEVTGLDMVTTNRIEGPLAKHLVGQAPEDLHGFPSDSFDVVMAFDFIEHLGVENGFELVYEMERITNQFAIVFTPNGFVWQPPTRSNPFQAHVSGWTPRMFRKLGWRTKGSRGLRAIFQPHSLLFGASQSKLFLALFSGVNHLFARLGWLTFSFVAVFKKSERYRRVVNRVESGASN